MQVVEVVDDKRIVLHWGAAEGTGADPSGNTTVTMAFEQLDDGTRPGEARGIRSVDNLQCLQRVC